MNTRRASGSMKKGRGLVHNSSSDKNTNYELCVKCSFIINSL